jgi:1-acyl-sn-glycerol-3-phosphate acyltransferase
MDQPMFQLFQRKLAAGEWCHIFPEGRVWQNWRFAGNTSAPILGEFKYGVGKLVAHCYPNVPIVLPIYHRGMSGVVPEKGGGQQRHQSATDSDAKGSNSMAVTQRKTAHRPSPPRSLIPQCGNKIECYIGEPLNFTDTVAAFNGEHPGELQGWKTTSTRLLRLYEEITLAVRNAVLKLEAEAYSRAPANADAVQSRWEVAAAVTAPAAVEDKLCGARELVEL